MSAPETPAPIRPAAAGRIWIHGRPAAAGRGQKATATRPSQAAPEGTTRRGLLDKLTARLTGLYDAREARSIALIALAELAGFPYRPC